MVARPGLEAETKTTKPALSGPSPIQNSSANHDPRSIIAANGIKRIKGIKSAKEICEINPAKFFCSPRLLLFVFVVKARRHLADVYANTNADLMS
jgi:hypothetical protein